MLVVGLTVAVATPAEAALRDKLNDYNRDGNGDLVAIGVGTNGYWLGDLNSDGNADLVAIGEGVDHLSVWYGYGNSTLSAAAQLGSGWGTTTRPATSPEWAISTGTATVTWWRSTSTAGIRGTGTATDPVGTAPGRRIGAGWHGIYLGV